MNAPVSAPLLAAGVGVLILAWAGPLPAQVPGSFTAHMTLHMAVTGLAAPLIAAGLADAVGRWRAFARPAPLAIAASCADLVVIWGWHSPALHRAARTVPAVLALEQAMFAAVAVLIWLTALVVPRPADQPDRQVAALAGALALFFTSMHMTLLGALIALAGRPLFGGALDHAHATADQQIGGAIMLGVGAAVYLAGGLMLSARVLRREAA